MEDVQIVGVLPHVDAKDGSQTLLNDRVLVLGGDDAESTVRRPRLDEPAPAAAVAGRSAGRHSWLSSRFKLICL